MLTKKDVEFLTGHLTFGVVGCFHKFEDHGDGTRECKYCGKTQASRTYAAH